MAGFPRPAKALDPLYNQGVCMLRQCFALSKPGSAVLPPHSAKTHPNSSPEISRARGPGPGHSAQCSVPTSSRSSPALQAILPVGKHREPPYVCLRIATPIFLLPTLKELADEHSQIRAKSKNQSCSRVRVGIPANHQVKSNRTHATVPSPFPQLSQDLIPYLAYQIPEQEPSISPYYDPTVNQGLACSHVSRIHASPPIEKRPHLCHDPSDRPTPSQLSFVLLKLREELPAFFDGHHSYDMYSSDIIFENNLSKHAWTQRGRKNYKAFLTFSRAMVSTCYSSVQLDLLKITKETEGGYIEARWRVRGRPRFRWSREYRVILEGFSTFVVNSDGLICVHRLEKVMPAAKEKGRVVSWAARLVFNLGQVPRSPALGLRPQPP